VKQASQLLRELVAELRNPALDKYKAAVEIARSKGEHYPVCNMPPPEVMRAGLEAHREWMKENRGRCTCWKADMEVALR
jgi:hypothetical protein